MKSQESLSQLLARILDQLSISAWLPAGALVFVVVLYSSLRTNGGNFGEAVRGFGSMNFSSVVLLFGAVVLVTMLTQAFEFGAIRFLEGYWGAGWLGSRLADLRCAVHIRRRERWERVRRDLELNAFASARPNMLVRNVPRKYADILEADLTGGELPADASPQDCEDARQFDWHEFAPSGSIRRLDGLTARIEDYPPLDYRVLPTRLGNTLRSAEDRSIESGGGSREGSVQRLFHELPTSIQSEHDQHRGRLDLYCSVFVVFLLAAIAAYPVLLASGWQLPTVTVVIALSLTWLSYRAAIASARAYGTTLETISRLREGGAIAPSEAPAATSAAS